MPINHEKYELVDMPLLAIGGKERHCDGCCFIRIGRERKGFPDSKSRTCIGEKKDPAYTAEATGCVISDVERKIWKRKKAVL